MTAEITLPETNATVVDRVRYLIKVLGKTQAQFGQSINVDASNMSKFMSGRIPITDGFMNRIVVNLGVSKAWLAYGEGVPFSKDVQPGTVNLSRHIVRGMGAPVYDIDVTAGFGEISKMFTHDRIIGNLDLPSLNPKYPVVHVSGDSMSPRIPNGSLISIRPISSDSPIVWGQVYVVILDDYCLVKSVRKNADPSKVTLHSYNPDFEDMDIPRDSIRQLFVVDTVINCEVLA